MKTFKIIGRPPPPLPVSFLHNIYRRTECLAFQWSLSLFFDIFYELCCQMPTRYVCYIELKGQKAIKQFVAQSNRYADIDMASYVTLLKLLNTFFPIGHVPSAAFSLLFVLATTQKKKKKRVASVQVCARPTTNTR